MDKQLIENIISKYDTPVYVFDINVLRNRIKYLKEKLSEKITLCYAIKANTFIIKDIEDIIDRFEVCSPGEYEICEAKNIDQSKILISGVYKTPKIIAEMLANDQNINYYTIESMEQFKLFKNTKNKIKLLLRLTSGNQFGINEEELESIISNREKYPNIEIEGIQYFSGTQKLSLKNIERELNYLDEYIKNISKKYNFEIKELEIGGGFPVQYFESSEFNEEEYLDEFTKIIDEMNFDGKIILELGRSITASSGTYITKVVDVKINKNGNFAIVDGGMNHLVYYGQSMAMKVPKFEIYPERQKSETDENWNICGALCTINDILMKQIPISNLEIGDILIFKNTGAYCMTEGISLFLSRDLPYIIKIKENNEIEVVRNNIPTYNLNM